MREIVASLRKAGAFLLPIFSAAFGILIAAGVAWYFLQRATTGQDILKELKKKWTPIRSSVTTKLVSIPEEYGEIKDLSVVFDSSQKRVAYVVSREKKQLVVLEGKPGPAHDETTDFLFSPDGRRFAYRVRDENTWFMVLDGVEEKYYDGLGVPIFSSDSQHFGYVAYSGRKGWQFPVIDGKEVAYYEGVWAISYSPDSKRLAFMARRDGVLAVVDGKEDREYRDGTWISDFVWTSDSAQYAYAVTAPDGSGFVVRGKIAGKRYEGVGQLVFSEDGQHLAHVAVKDGKGLVVRDGEEGATFYDVFGGRVRIWDLAFSPDGGILAFVGMQDGKTFVVRNDLRFGPYESAKRPVFSRDGKQFAYIAQVYVGGEVKTKEQVIFNGEKLEEYGRIVGRPLFSDDGRFFAYVAERDGQQFVVVNDREGKPYDRVWNPKFSDDGKSVVYNARAGRDIWLVVEKVR
ncbi:MAG: PD40 domain-containing protein [Parcubacteria group bacterium]|nr:PD40 domain-containing protein [Parcubacteria group bacterium]